MNWLVSQLSITYSFTRSSHILNKNLIGLIILPLWNLASVSWITLEVENLHQLHKLDYQKFIDYNIKDVELVDQIEDKMKLIEMALAIAYDAKVNYNDTFTQVTMWDVLIHNYLMSKNIVDTAKGRYS